MLRDYLIEEDFCENEDTESNPIVGKWIEGDSLAPPCQADLDVVEAIIDFAGLSSSSYLMDLGCGDGRICLRASQKYGCRSMGCELEPNLVEKFVHHISSYGLSGLVSAICDDLRNIDLSKANVITLYLLPDAIEDFKCELESVVRRGAILICNTWGPKGWKPVAKTQCGFCNNVTLLKYDSSSLENLY